MNKILTASLLLGAALTFSACSNEEDDIFDQSAAERLNAAVDLYSSRLEAQPNGWAMQLYPTLQNEAPYGNGYLVLIDFNPDQSVRVAMNNTLTNGDFAQDISAWQVITDDGPVITFNTHNKVMHLFSDPNDVPSTGTNDAPNDETGTGIGGDYEFIIVDAPEDASYMMLKGKKRGTYNLLTPMEEGVDYSTYLSDVKNWMGMMFSSKSPTFDVIHFGDTLYKMEGASDGIPNIYPYDADAVLNESFDPFLVTKRGDQYYLRFRDAHSTNGYTVQDFHYLADKDIFQSVDNEKCYISGDSPSRFFKQLMTDSVTRTWKTSLKDENSSAYASLVDALTDAMSPNSRTFQYVSLRHSKADGYQIGITYRERKSTRTAYFNCEFSFGEDGTVTISAPTPKDNNARTLVEAYGAKVNDLLSFYATTFTITPNVTAFDLSSIKLVSKADANKWVIMNL